MFIFLILPLITYGQNNSPIPDETPVHCRQVQCDSLPVGTCAEVQNEVWTLSTTSCDIYSTQSCNYDVVWDFFDTYDGQPFENELLCSPISFINFTEEEADLLCQNADLVKQERLVDGHPKIWQSDADCLLVNGEYTRCKCNVNGIAYCALNLGDISITDMVMAACNRDLLSLDFYQSYIRAWPLQLENRKCTDTVTEEILLGVFSNIRLNSIDLQSRVESWGIWILPTVFMIML